MSDFARMMELALAGGANPEDVSGMPREPAEKEPAKAEHKPAPPPADHRESRDKK